MKLLILSNFTFFHNIFLMVFSSMCSNEYIQRKGLTQYQTTKILDKSNLIAFADNKINVIEKPKFHSKRVENYVEKRRKCWLQAFSPFPAMFSKDYFFKVIKSWNCVVEVTLYHIISSFNDLKKESF